MPFAHGARNSPQFVSAPSTQLTSRPVWSGMLRAHQTYRPAPSEIPRKTGSAAASLGDGHCGIFQPGELWRPTEWQNLSRTGTRASTYDVSMLCRQDRTDHMPSAPTLALNAPTGRATSCCRHYAYAVPYSRYVCCACTQAMHYLQMHILESIMMPSLLRTSRRANDRVTCIVVSPRLMRMQVKSIPSLAVAHCPAW